MEGAASTTVVRTLQTGDVGAVVRLHCEIFAQSPSGRLGPLYVTGMFRWLLQYQGGVALAAENDAGEVIGYAVGAPRGHRTQHDRDLRFRVMVALLFRPWVLLDAEVATGLRNRLGIARRTRSQPTTVTTATGVPAEAAGQMLLRTIAVNPAARRAGVGQRLLSEFEARAVKAGAREARLTVRVDNLCARALYERNGWEPGRSFDNGSIVYTKHLR